MPDAGQPHIHVVEAAMQQIGDHRGIGHVGNAQQKMATGRGDVTKVGEKGPGLVEMLDDIAADDPVEFLFEDGDDLPGVAAIDVVDSLAGHRCRLRIELDSDDAAFLSGLQGRAEGSLAAAELEDGLRLGADARQQIFPMLPAERAPAVDVVASRENHRPPG